MRFVRKKFVYSFVTCIASFRLYIYIDDMRELGEETGTKVTSRAALKYATYVGGTPASNGLTGCISNFFIQT